MWQTVDGGIIVGRPRPARIRTVRRSSTVEKAKRHRTLIFIITSYFNGAHGALLVFDITNRNTFDRLDYWLEQLDRGSNDFKGKIVVLGAKSDLTSRREVSYEEAEEYCNINNLRYLECSSKDNINIDESFKVLLEEIVNTPVETAQHKYMSSFKLDEEHTLYKSKSCCIIQ